MIPDNICEAINKRIEDWKSNRKGSEWKLQAANGKYKAVTIFDFHVCYCGFSSNQFRNGFIQHEWCAFGTRGETNACYCSCCFRCYNKRTTQCEGFGFEVGKTCLPHLPIRILQLSIPTQELNFDALSCLDITVRICHRTLHILSSSFHL